ncbi:hypothetical protein Tco_1287704, partial [Tanacetum coccineum]
MSFSFQAKHVPSAERVKISPTNIRLETTVPKKEEMFQVYTIKKLQDTDSYEFLLANKKCTINAEVFRTILDICPRVEGVDFADLPDDDIALTFLIDLAYKGPLNRHTNMFVDHMHQPWRTLAAIINKCLSGKLESNEKLRKSRINILWGMFNIENVDYLELIWEDLAYQIDHRKEKRSRHENMPYPRFTKIIINYFLKQYKSLTNLNHKHYHTIKDAGIVSRLKFVRIGEDYQEYGHPILDVMLTDAIKHLESYQMFIKYSTNQIPPKKNRGKAKKKTSTEEAEAARKVHATHARIVTEFVTEFAKKKSGMRSSKSVVIQDTLFLTPAEQEAANIMQALKESKKTSRRQPGTGGSNEGTGSKPGVPDESTVISAASNKQDSEHSDDDNDEVEKDDKDGDADDEGDDHVSNAHYDDEDVETKSNEDDIYKYKIRVRKDEDAEMKDVKVEESDKGEERVTDEAKEEAEKTSEAKDDTKNTELPPSSSSLSISLGFGDQFLKLSSDSSLVSIVKDSVDADVSSLLDIPIQHETPQIQSPPVQKIPILVNLETTNLPPILEIIIETPVTTVVPSPQVTPII